MSQRLIGFTLRTSSEVSDSNGNGLVEFGVITDTINCEELVWTQPDPFSNMNTAIDGTIVT